MPYISETQSSSKWILWIILAYLRPLSIFILNSSTCRRVQKGTSFPSVQAAHVAAVVCSQPASKIAQARALNPPLKENKNLNFEIRG